MTGPLTQQASVPAAVERFDGSGAAGQVLTLAVKPLLPLSYVATRVKDNDGKLSWKELQEGSGVGTYSVNAGAKTVTLNDAVPIDSDNAEVHYFYDPVIPATLDTTLLAKESKQDSEIAELQAIKGFVDTLEVLSTAIRDRLGDSATENTVIKELLDLQLLLDTVEAKLQSLIDSDAFDAATDRRKVAVEASVLPVGASTEATLAAIKARADLLSTEATLEAVRLLLDTVETKLQTLIDQTDTVEAKLQSVIDNTDTIEVKLADLAAQASFDHGRKSAIGAIAVAITASSIPAKHGVLVIAGRLNAGQVYAGNSDVTADTADATDGAELQPGDSVFIKVDNANKVFVIGSTTGLKVFWVVV